MKQQIKSSKEQKQRRLLVVLPLLILPFVTILFWVLGGANSNPTTVATAQQKGFNTKLPQANLKEEGPLDKMSYYDLAALDSAKRDELIKKDPNYLREPFPIDAAQDSSTLTPREARPGWLASEYRNSDQQKVQQKLQALQRAISAPVYLAPQDRDQALYRQPNETSLQSKEVDRLEQMMQSMQGQEDGEDPELQQLGGMLENILDIQHPQRVQEKLKKASEAQRGQVFAISTTIQEDPVSSVLGLGATAAQLGQSGFYSLAEPQRGGLGQNTIEAVVHNTQTIVNGALVQLRLTSAIFINGTQIPKNHFLFGTASLKGERLTIKINSIRYNNLLFPVDLSVYDLDGLVGIFIPGAINRDVAKASAERSLQTLGVASLDDSWGAQAAGVGIEAAKSLLSKKVKLVKVVVKAGYQVLLYDEKLKLAN
jgi:conjugative transposon TraM protein